MQTDYFRKIGSTNPDKAGKLIPVTGETPLWAPEWVEKGVPVYGPDTDMALIHPGEFVFILDIDYGTPYPEETYTKVLYDGLVGYINRNRLY
jgi:hypothetical protein